MQVRVEVQPDHLELLSNVPKPILAIAELVWNSLDADAEHVSVEIEKNELGGIQLIRVSDDGHGISYEEAPSAFGHLGGSWKKSTAHTKLKHRLLHGKAGKGRFRAFALGNEITWITRFEENEKVKGYKILGRRSELGAFEIGDCYDSDERSTGTSVLIESFTRDISVLTNKSAILDLTTHFALYLEQYPEVRVMYCRECVAPRAMQEHRAEYTLPLLEVEDGREISSSLVVVEWSSKVDRSLCLCDADGFTLAELPPGIHAPGYSFTAYLRCALLRELDNSNALVLGESLPDLKQLLDAAREQLREHFRRRSAQAATTLVEEWKREEIYPYSGEPVNIVERAEREVFDVLAVNVSSYLPRFEEENTRSKKLSFHLLRQALVESPKAVQRILSEVLELPKEKQEELVDLLERTSLVAIINASREVADRLDFLRTLELLLFKYKEHFLERSQLHKLLEDRTWLFGEEFALSVSDQSLTEVLKKHLELLRKDELCLEGNEVLDEQGRRCIVDLMLSRLVPQSQAEQREHLIVELKRPSQPITSSVIQQVQRYALAVATDERFRNTDTRWVFWAISNRMTEEALLLAKQSNRPEGLVYETESPNLKVWIKDWGNVLESCRARLSFFQERLQYTPEDQSALEKLRKLHEKYLPSLDMVSEEATAE